MPLNGCGGGGGFLNYFEYIPAPAGTPLDVASAGAADVIAGDPTAGSFVANLPKSSVAGKGRRYYMKNIGTANAMITTPDPGDTIDLLPPGAPSVIGPQQVQEIIADGTTRWEVISNAV